MNFNKLNETALKEVFSALEETFKKLNIDYYLIGAIARDIWYTRGNKNFRTTKDIDFAAMVGSLEEYQSVKDYLKDHKGFQDSKGNSFVMTTSSGFQVDILPFGEIEIDDTIQLKGTGLTSIKVNGFMEVFNGGTEEVTMASGQVFQVATLASIILLKLIAFDDRPEYRLKDARDIANILFHYFELEQDQVYGEENKDIFTSGSSELDELSLPEIGSLVAGRTIHKIIVGNDILYARIIRILEQHISQKDESVFVRNMSQEVALPVNEIIKWLQKLNQGISRK
jgi:predicted nucleotidyltransferase